MIVGNDVSGIGQGDINWPLYKNNTNFVWMKATEGSDLIDSEFGNNRQQARNLNIPRGFYHVTHDELGNTPQQEFEQFSSVIDGQPIQQYENIALDYGEQGQGADPAEWVLQFCQLLHSHYNSITIWLYLNQSLATNIDWMDVIHLGYVKLWGAGYTSSPDNIAFLNFGWWGLPLCRQWTDAQTVPGIIGNMDGDVFNGTVEQFNSYGFQITAPKISTPVSPAVTEPKPSTPTPVSPTPTVTTPPVTPPTPGTSEATVTQVPSGATTPVTPSVPTPQASWVTTLQSIASFIQYCLGKEE